MAREGIATATNLFDFFHERMEAATRRRSAVSEESQLYLTQMLVERGRLDEPGRDRATLAELYGRANQASPVERVRSWRELADRALYITGFFRQSLRRGLVSADYYMQMGSTAYLRLARLVGGPRSGGPRSIGEGRGLDEVWTELGERFEDASDLLQDVHEDISSADVANERDVLRLYESWLATGSPRLLARLEELGVAPLRVRPVDEPS